MASQTRSIKIPGDLAQAAELRAKQLGYPSWGAYVKGLMRYDMLVQGSHDVTLPMAHLPLMEQDKVDAKLLEATKKGKGERGQLLAHMLERMQKGEKVAKAME
ncbi:MAG TPA: hypothetical protein VLE43_00010 [Candidatus Saccharimonadia bacterium]|nr:hypothetical protein [Candidatus Saccharimonadia bacterium]